MRLATVLPGAWPLESWSGGPSPGPSPQGTAVQVGFSSLKTQPLHLQEELGLQQGGWDLDPLALNGA